MSQKVTKTCIVCGETFKAKPKDAPRAAYCSRLCQCRDYAKRNKITPEDERKIIDAYASGLTLQRAGEVCGYGRGGAKQVLMRWNIKSRTISQATKGRTFTDATKQKISDNHADVSGAKNPWYGKLPESGLTVSVPHLGCNVRSIQEAKLSEIMFNAGIIHEYETKRFIMSDRTYAPDFYIPETDTHVELKMACNERWPKVLAGMKSEHPEAKLVIVDYRMFKKVTRNPELIRSILCME